MTTQTQPQTNVVTLTIDGKSISVPKGTTVYNAAKSIGIEIPIFCYQDRMPPFGACRMCLVEVEKMPKLQTSCTLEVSEGMVVNTQSENAVNGRKGIIEFLLVNHPLDCPICDRGGECPLQDQTVEHGPGASRFYEEKRHFEKPLPLGPVLVLDRERCIQCARCTRFSDIISGDHALEFLERGFKTEVGTPDGGPAQSKYIGNTIKICPVGALTSEVYRFRARPWDNKPTETTCTLCPVGCSMILDERDGEIMRTRSCENHDVNDIWLCDKGWFGYEYTEHKDRIDKPLIRKNGKLQEATWDEALNLIAQKLKEFKTSGKIAAFGGNPLTTEENYLYQKLFREGLGTNHLDHRVGMPVLSLDEEGIQSGMEISIGETEKLSYVVILGLDLTEEFPIIWLRLKQAINNGAKVIFVGHYKPEIAPYFVETILHAPGEEQEALKQVSAFLQEHAQNGKGALFVGRQYLATKQRLSVLSSLLQLKKDHANLSLNLLEGRGNSFGARYAGMRPDLNPLGEKAQKAGLSNVDVLREASKNGWDYIHVAGANPAEKVSEKLWKSAREKLSFLVVQDLFLTETAREADVVLPALSFVEKRGSIINVEGRVQKLAPGKPIPENVYSDGEIFIFIGEKLNIGVNVDSYFSESLKQPRIKLNKSVDGLNGNRNQAENHQSAFKTSFSHSLFDHGTRMKRNPHLIQMSKKPYVKINPSDGEKQGLKDEQVVNISANGNTIFAPLKFDKNVAKGTAVLPLGYPDVPVFDLDINILNGVPIEIKPAKIY